MSEEEKGGCSKKELDAIEKYIKMGYTMHMAQSLAASEAKEKPVEKK